MNGHHVRVARRGPYRTRLTGQLAVDSIAVFKGGMKCTYQHCGEAHLHRYLAESISATAAAVGVEDSDGHDMRLIAIRGKRLKRIWKNQNKPGL